MAGSEEPSHFQMVTHTDKLSQFKHVRRCNGPSLLEIASIIPNAEDGIAGRRNIVLRRQGFLKSNESKVLDTTHVTHSPYRLLIYVLLLPVGQDGRYI